MIETCQKIAEKNGSTLEFTEDVEAGVKGANVVYTDVWVSMGEPFEVWQTRINELLPYKVTAKVMDMANENAVFMHCLPAYHDKNTKIGKENFLASFNQIFVREILLRTASYKVNAHLCTANHQ